MRISREHSAPGPWALPILLVFIFATSASGQGLFGGLPALPFLGSFSGSPRTASDGLCPGAGLEAYIGYMEDRSGTTLSADREGGPGLSSITNHFTNRGIWFGLTGSTCPGANFSFTASGWYLLPFQSDSRKDYRFSFGLPQGRTWEIDHQWWFVDGLFAWNSPAGMTLLAGLRYDYHDIRFKNASDVVVIASLGSDTADNTSQAWIPLVGTQYALYSSMGNVVFRVVGFPTIFGSTTFKETAGGGRRVEAKGTYDSGYFLEAFAEYSWSFGPGTIGLFARWNGLDAKTTTETDTVTIGGPISNSSPRVTFRRQSWTVGGNFSLDFYSPL